MFDRIRLGTLLSICLLVAPFIGCGSSTTLDSITVTPTTVNFGGAGLTAQLTAIGTVDHGSHPSTTENVTDLVTWSTGSSDVATVNSTGLVTSRNIESNIDKESFKRKTVLLCSEPTAEHCHRRLVLEYLAERWEGVTIHHI